MLKWQVVKSGTTNGLYRYRCVDSAGNIIFSGEQRQCAKAAAAHNFAIDNAA